MQERTIKIGEISFLLNDFLFTDKDVGQGTSWKETQKEGRVDIG